MAGVALVVSLVVSAVALVTGAWGAWLWQRLEADPRYWIGVRATQAGALLLTLLAGAVWLAPDSEPDNWLFWLYALLPLAVSLVAEQLRIVAAEQVLERRGLEGAADVRGLDEPAQRAIVREIVRREVGVMAAAALVIAFLALRIVAERGGL
ncbi:hypothetical protein SK069_05390 [Patulibacter brassicae]|uniref:DUF2269 family protein n=1 Tax=Patulibacter brassicae TaxID=1705717 RepID=A0ABU4VGR5_9ACTN|nr:hypothetical protein [Patulibacter brassicae]MDX8151017.1 hypothetical protein [Patulibacter brassicae]